MNKSMVYAEHAPRYREAGYWSRPIWPSTKACHSAGWQTPDPELQPGRFEQWLQSSAAHGIGLLMGSPFPDGTTLGALDIDRDEYVRVGKAVLGDPPCGRIGKKGAVFFVRVRGQPRNFEFRVDDDFEKRWGKVAECLFFRKLCVIPPTLHPDTKRPYEWIGKDLITAKFEELPIVEI